AGADAPVVAAVGADIEGAEEAVPDVDMAAPVAFLPGVRRDLQLHPFGRARLTFLFEPGHSRHRMILERDNLGGPRSARQPRRRTGGRRGAGRGERSATG